MPAPSPQIDIRRSPCRITVTSAGRMVAESSEALELHEGELPAVFYLPRADINPEMLTPSDRRSRCPHKGEAAYFHVGAEGCEIEDAAWHYPSPKPEVAAIAGHVAFYPAKVDVLIGSVTRTKPAILWGD